MAGNGSTGEPLMGTFGDSEMITNGSRASIGENRAISAGW
jgi:hypothetical protein